VANIPILSNRGVLPDAIEEGFIEKATKAIPISGVVESPIESTD